MTKSQRSLLVVVGSLALSATTYVAIPFSTMGCGNCSAVCVDTATATGTLTLPDTSAHTYTVQYCVATTCRDFTLTVGGASDQIVPVDSGTAPYHAGFVTRVDATHVSLELLIFNLDVNVGDTVTVQATETTTNAVAVDQMRTLADVGQRSVCSDVCEQPTVNWDMP